VLINIGSSTAMALGLSLEHSLKENEKIIMIRVINY